MIASNSAFRKKESSQTANLRYGTDSPLRLQRESILCVKIPNMETTTLTIHLPKDVRLVLEDKAHTSGKGVAEYVEDLVSKQINRPTFRDLFADVRQAITVSDEALAQEIDSALVESRKSRRKRD